MRLYSQRNRPAPEYLVYHLEPNVRERILCVFEDHCPNYKGGFDALMGQMENLVVRTYGHMVAPGFEALRRSRVHIVEHFFSCSDEQALDFIEGCFRQQSYEGEQAGVDAINDIFLTSGIGFELTPFTYTETKVEGGIFGGRKARVPVYPQIIRRDEHAIQQHVVDETIKLLSDPKLSVANGEMIGAFVALRNQQFERAVTLAGSAFESLMKTICVLKGWQYDPQKDTCSKLVNILRDNGLFPGFYAPSLEAVGTIRNKISEAHGRGPHGIDPVSQAQAEHLIHLTATQMLFLAKQAGLA